jgi:hypothetical protein
MRSIDDIGWDHPAQQSETVTAPQHGAHDDTKAGRLSTGQRPALFLHRLPGGDFD